MLSFPAEIRGSGAQFSVGVEVRDPSDGSTAVRSWTFIRPGMGGYVVSAGGPPIFGTTPSPLPHLSLANYGTWRQPVAVPGVTHPCPVTYSYDSSCSPGTNIRGSLHIYPPTGELGAVGNISFLATGTYCLAVDAVVEAAGSRFVLDSRSFPLDLVP